MKSGVYRHLKILCIGIFIFIGTYEGIWAATFGGGSGSKENPYIISSVEHLNMINDSLNSITNNTYFILANNIDLQGISIQPIGQKSPYFRGNFDGRGHTISNLNILPATLSYSTSDAGLFGIVASGATVKKLNLYDAYVSGSYDVGLLVGENNGTVEACISEGIARASSECVGGLVGKNDGLIKNSSSNANVASSSNYVGGLVGRANGNILNCYARGNVKSSNYYAGGLVGGLNSATIQNSYATGVAAGYSKVGGLVGYSYSGLIESCYATGGANQNNTYDEKTYEIGALVGESNNSTIKNSYGNKDLNAYIYIYTGYTDKINVELKTTEEMQKGDFVTLLNAPITSSYWLRWMQNSSINQGYPFHSKGNTSYRACLETPSSNETVEGIKKISGWYINTIGISEVQILVDGVVQGNASLTDRPGLGELFPGYNTSKATFSYNLDTTKLSVGTHTLVIRAIGVDTSVDETAPTSIQVKNEPAFRANVELPANNAIVQGITRITGWYINKKGINKVEIWVDGTLKGTATRFSRAGFETIFPSYNVTNAGFLYDLNTANLTDGEHDIVIKAINVDNISDSQNIKVNVSNKSYYLGNIETPMSEEKLKDLLTISGWYANTQGIQSVEVLVNDSSLGYATRFNRPGLDTALPGYNTDKAGFVYYVNTHNLVDGRHKITVRARGIDGSVDEKATFITVANASLYLGNIETPGNGSVTNNVILVSGWYVNTGNISRVDILINNAYLGTAVRYERPGLQEALPGYNAKNGGFAFYINTKNLVNGTYTLTAQAIGEDGASHSLNIKMTVSNTQLYMVPENKLLEDGVAPEEPEVIEEPKVTPEESEVIEEPKVAPEELEVIEEPKVAPEELEVIEEPKVAPEEPEVIEEPKVTPEKSSVIEESQMPQTLNILE